MKYTVGDLIDDRVAGLGYISNITKDKIQITWFSMIDRYHIYDHNLVDRWLKNEALIHYPLGNQ